MRLDVDGFSRFAAQITIPSKDEGLIKFDHLWGTQLYCLYQIAAGLEDDIHDFVIGKGRQVGETTKNDTFRLWWPQTNSGTQGLFVSNSDENRDYRRDVCLEMLASLPIEYRHEVRVNNRNLLAWQPNPAQGFGGSRLMFDAFGTRGGTDLGRSRGINFLDADEVGLAPDDRDVEALRASLSTRNPNRLYLWNGTGNGYNIFHDMVKTAQKATTQRFIFIGAYRHENYRIDPASSPEHAVIWDKYDGRMTSEEKAWARDIKRREGFDVPAGFWIWYRFILDEQFYGNEAMRAQEFPCTPDEMFQAFGDRFIAPEHIRALQRQIRVLPTAKSFRYEWRRHLEDSSVHPCDPHTATLKVWDDPVEWGAYIVAGHPWGSSSPDATHWVAQVFRAWPDHLEQVAEYSNDVGTTQEFAWIMIHLCGLYRDPHLPFRVIEVQGPGLAVEKHFQLFTEHGFGLGRAARAKGVQDIMGAARHYFWTKPDHLGGKSPTLDIQTNATERPYFAHMLADVVVRGQMTVRSEKLIASLSGLRRGEGGDNDEIKGGAAQSDAHAMCAMLAVRCWQDQAMGDLERTVPQHAQQESDRQPHMAEVVAGEFLAQLVRTGRPRRTRW